MATDNSLSQFKNMQKVGWGLFTPIEMFTIPAAATLTEFAEIKPGQKVLDCACGTGVVAITAALKGAKVKALDLSPTLLERAKENSQVSRTEIEFTEGDVEALPYADGEFDVVLSQYGHMFAPRPDVTVKEMLRVLRPGGRIAFSTWPPDHLVGLVFKLAGKYVPAPEGAAPPHLWGEPAFVRERLGDAVKDLVFDRSEMQISALSPMHMRDLQEKTIAPLAKLVSELESSPEKLSRVRAELEDIIRVYWRGNAVHQHYLMTRATKI